MNKENIDITDVKINTKRLYLRMVNMSDLEDMFNYAKVEGVGEMAGWPHHRTIEDTKKVLETFIKNKNQFAVIYKGKMIGSLGIEKYDEVKLPELKDKVGREVGLVIGKDYQGMGFGPEALKGVIDYLFNKEKLDFIVAGYFSFNDKSKKMQEGLGFETFKVIKAERMGMEFFEIMNVMYKEKIAI